MILMSFLRAVTSTRGLRQSWTPSTVDNAYRMIHLAYSWPPIAQEALGRSSHLVLVYWQSHLRKINQNLQYFLGEEVVTTASTGGSRFPSERILLPCPASWWSTLLNLSNNAHIISKFSYASSNSESEELLSPIFTIFSTFQVHPRPTMSLMTLPRRIHPKNDLGRRHKPQMSRRYEKRPSS